MKTIYGGGYGALGLSQDQFRTVCEKLANDLPRLLDKYNATAVVVRGSSGVSVAFGIRMIDDVPTIVARKAAENAHGGPINSVGGTIDELERYIFLDDLIDSGRTLEGVVSDMRPCECVAAVMYGGSEPTLRRYGLTGNGIPYYRY